MNTQPTHNPNATAEATRHVPCPHLGSTALEMNNAAHRWVVRYLIACAQQSGLMVYRDTRPDDRDAHRITIHAATIQATTDTAVYYVTYPTRDAAHRMARSAYSAQMDTFSGWIEAHRAEAARIRAEVTR